ncbi:MAG: hypothetical protein WCO35_01790 [Candidatus Nomurabacteria bacterium]
MSVNDLNELEKQQNEVVVNDDSSLEEELRVRLDEFDIWGQSPDDPNYNSQPYWALLEEQYGR